MDGQDVVELKLRLPAGELGRLAKLMEQVREVLAMGENGAAAPSPSGESGVNTVFDAVRFRQLEEAEGAFAGGKPAPELPAGQGRAEFGDAAPTIPPAEAPGDSEPAEAASAGAGVQESPAAVSAAAEVLGELEIPAAEAELSQGPETPAGTLEAIEQTEPEAPPVKPAEVEPGPEPPLPAVPEVRRGFEEAQSVGAAVEAEVPEVRGGDFAAVEELVGPGAAPLTAEAVALAFQRDDRRYDNGFPLY